MALVRAGIEFFDLPDGTQVACASRLQFNGIPLIEASGLPYGEPGQWGVIKLVNVFIPPDVQYATVYSKILYDRCTLVPYQDIEGITWSDLILYCTVSGRRYTDAIAIWDVYDDGT